MSSKTKTKFLFLLLAAILYSCVLYVDKQVFNKVPIVYYGRIKEKAGLYYIEFLLDGEWNCGENGTKSYEKAELAFELMQYRIADKSKGEYKLEKKQCETQENKDES